MIGSAEQMEAMPWRLADFSVHAGVSKQKAMSELKCTHYGQIRTTISAINNDFAMYFQWPALGN